MFKHTLHITRAVGNSIISDHSYLEKIFPSLPITDLDSNISWNLPVEYACRVQKPIYSKPVLLIQTKTSFAEQRDGEKQFLFLVDFLERKSGYLISHDTTLALPVEERLCYEKQDKV